MGWLRDWRRSRVLKQGALDPDLWRAAVDRYPFIHALSDAELARLADLTMLFLHEKAIHGAGGMSVRDEMRIAIGAQASLLILNLGLDYYRGWVEIIVYPDEFVAEFEYTDEAGIAHRVEEPMTGEAWERGPVILSWADAQAAGRGLNYNVVIHEFAHKLDMLNGDANGFPPLHAGMERARWADAFTAAYADFCRKVDSGEEIVIDDYAAQNPAEFFAVMSEAFFESPQHLRESYPDVYDQMARFYRQDPAARIAGGNAHAAPLRVAG